ncbi:MAG: hypothetical protein KDC66_03180, partial [Phaeodactylibacter sp.]|nr:hypothetical protein [Phaeodactylibacter sp.]
GLIHATKPLHTDNFKRDFQNLIDNDVKIVRGPSFEDYGTVAVFEDLYGNLWDLIEPKQALAKPPATPAF